MIDVTFTAGTLNRPGVSPLSKEPPSAKTEKPTRPEDTQTGNPVPETRQHPADTNVSLQIDVEKAVGKLNDYVRTTQRELRFTLDSELGKPIVTVLDQETNEIIRQMPTDVAIRLARNLIEKEKEIAIQAEQLRPGAGGVTSSGSTNPVPLIDTKI